MKVVDYNRAGRQTITAERMSYTAKEWMTSFSRIFLLALYFAKGYTHMSFGALVQGRRPHQQSRLLPSSHYNHGQCIVMFMQKDLAASAPSSQADKGLFSVLVFKSSHGTKTVPH